MTSRNKKTDAHLRDSDSDRIRAIGPIELLMVCAAWLAILAFLVHEIYSLDVWWQVTIGRDILATLDIPSLDRYSAAGLGRPYHDSHWLFQVVLGLLHGPLGMVGVQVAMIALWCSILVFCYRSCRFWTTPAVSAVLMFLAAMASVERFLPRPELVTFLGIVVFYDLLQRRSHRSAAGLVALALMQVAWANSHGLFVIGPFMVGCYWLWEAVGRVRGSGPDLAAVSRALAVVAIATLLTPFGFDGWRYAALLFTEVGSQAPTTLAGLGELSPTFGAASMSAPAFWFFAGLLGLVIISMALMIRKRRFSPRTLIIAGLLLAALTGRRNIVMFALVAAPLAAESLGDLVASIRKTPRVAAAAAAALMLAWAWFPLSGGYYLRMEIPARFGIDVTPSFFPHGLPAFLDSIAFDGQVLNSNTIGGFYAYHGYPDRLPLTDGRWEVYEVDRLEFIHSATRGPGDWKRVIRDYDVEGILLAHTSPEAAAMAPVLQTSADWRMVYLDSAASFWLPLNFKDLPEEVDLTDLSTLPEIERPDDGLMLNSFLAAVGADELRLEVLGRTARYGKRLEIILPQLGELELAAGRHDDAQETFEALLRIETDNAAAMNELAYIAFLGGDLVEAKTMLERALAIDPQNADYRANLERIEATVNQPAGGGR